MKSITKVALGVLTSIGGFLEAGSIGTSLVAGAEYRFQLLWALVLGVVCIAFLSEMAGRLAAVSRHSVVDAMRKRFGFHVQVWPFAAQVLLDLLVLACELGGAAYALKLATGVPAPVWVVPVVAGVAFVLWAAKFGQIEHAMAALGMVTLCFVVAAVLLHPSWSTVGRGLVPTLSPERPVHYVYLAVSIIGASVSPYLITFYSSGAIEEKWKPADLLPNRLTAALGMGFGSAIAGAVIVVAALVLNPAGVHVQRFDDAAHVLTPAFGAWGFWLFCASLFIGCVGAAFETALDLGYVVSQTFGWAWSENRRAWTESRFALTYLTGLGVAALPGLLGVNPFQLTMLTMVLTALALPLVIAPLVVIMNDDHYLKDHTNGAISNAAVMTIAALAFLLAVVALPLQLLGS